MSRIATVRSPATSDDVPQATADVERIAWFDYAKGLCIIMVVMMHSTGGTAEAFHAAGWPSDGWVAEIVAFAKPFRMPDFFLLSGLFLFASIDRDWRAYLDRKVMHFAYFYVLWLLIQSVVRGAGLLASSPTTWLEHLAFAFVMPFPPLWFIYVLPLFFIATKLAKGLPPWLLWLIAGVLHVQPIRTGWPAIDVFAVHYYVYFVTGYLLAPQVLRLARAAAEMPGKTVLLLLAWALCNAVVALMPIQIAGFTRIADIPGLSIAAGLAGAMAVVATAALLARFDVLQIVRTCGANSLVLYTSFMLVMAGTRVALVKIGLVRNIDLASLIVIAAAIAMPLILHRLVRHTPARFLFERPDAFKLDRIISRLQPAARQGTGFSAGRATPRRAPEPIQAVAARVRPGTGWTP